MESTNPSKHIYGQALMIVLLTALIAGLGSMYSRLIDAEQASEDRMDDIEKNMLSEDVLNQRFRHWEYRIKMVESKCCSEVPVSDGGL